MKMMKMIGTPSGACPAYFKCSCMDAAKGGKNSYSTPGWNLSIHLDTELNDEAEEQLQQLAEFVDQEDDDAIWQWFKLYLPRCMKLVPVERKKTFLQGFWAAYEDGRIDF